MIYYVHLQFIYVRHKTLHARYARDYERARNFLRPVCWN